MPGFGRRGRGRVSDPVVESQETGEPPLPVACVPCLAGPVARPPRSRLIHDLAPFVQEAPTVPGEGRSPKVKMASPRWAARANEAAGRGAASRRDPWDEIGGGTTRVGRPIGGIRCDRLWGRWSASDVRGVELCILASRPDPVPGSTAFTTLVSEKELRTDAGSAAPLGIPGDRVLGAGPSDPVASHPACRRHAELPLRPVPPAPSQGSSRSGFLALIGWYDMT